MAGANVAKPGNGLAPPTREERVQLCMRLMRRLKWRRGTTDKNIAAHWGLTLDAVQSYSAEAFRRVKAEVTDPDATAATVCVALERVMREAAQKGMYGHKSIIEAAKTWAAIAGAGAPTRVEVGALATMTEEQLARRRDEIVARLQAEDRIAEEAPTEDEAAEIRAIVLARRERLTEAEVPDPGGGGSDAAALRASQGCPEDARALESRVKDRIRSGIPGSYREDDIRKRTRYDP